jgi:integrase
VQPALADYAPGDALYATAQSAGEYIQASKAVATRRAYDSDWRHFDAWCTRHTLVALPATPQTVALYIAYLAKPADGEPPRKAATISRRLTAINTVHKLAELDSPATMNHRVLASTFHGIRRTIGTGQTMKKPLTRDRLVRILNTLEGPIAAARDKALLLVGFAGALRRSELAALQVVDLSWQRKGVTLKLPRSKTDQEARGREVELVWGAHDQTCPVLALENWLKIANIKQGPVFRSVGQYGNIGGGLHPNSIGRLVKHLVRRAKLSTPQCYGGHSLRAGFVTEASANGATHDQIMKQTGHTSEAMVRRYARADREDKQAAGSKLGL